LDNGTQARADRRALISAALIGSGVGLALGAAYMAGGMSRVAADHARAEQVSDGVFSEAALQREAADSTAPSRAQDVAAQLRGEQGLDPHADKQRHATRDLDCLTDAVYFEARGESKRGQQAVATVVLNRVKNPNFPKSVCGVVFQRASGGCQFSFACDGSMRHGRDEDAWEQARRVAARALSGYVLRDIGSATHFHTIDVSPDWGSQMLKVAQVGLHVFYRRNPHAATAPEMQPEAQHAVFTSTPGEAQPTLRIATALVQSAPESSPPAAAPAPAQKPAAKPGPELPKTPPDGLSKASAPGLAKSPEATAS